MKVHGKQKVLLIQLFMKVSSVGVDKTAKADMLVFQVRKRGVPSAHSVILPVFPMRVRCLFFFLFFCSALAGAANDDLAGRISALKFEQSALRNSFSDQLQEQNARLNSELAQTRVQLQQLNEAQQAQHQQLRLQFAVFSALFLVAALGACCLPFYLAQRRQQSVRKEAETSARDLKTARDLLEQMRGDFKAIQGKMRDYRSEFDLRLAEMKLHELAMQQCVQTPALPAQDFPSAELAEPQDDRAVWRDEADSFRALLLAEPDEDRHRRKLVQALLQGLESGADVSDEGLRQCTVLLEQAPADADLQRSAGRFLLARALRLKAADDLAAAETYLLEAERLQRGIAAYELVVLYAQSGRLVEARKRLALARLAGVARLEKLALLQSDPQLAPLREQDWFQSYLQTLAEDLVLA